MAGKGSKAATSGAAAEPPAPEAPELQSEAASTAAKMEEGEVPDTDAPDSSAKAEEAASDESAAKPSTEAAQDDAVSHTSSGSDDKVNASSPSKKSPSKSKKGGRTSRGKSTSSKRSSEEQDTTKDWGVDASAEADASTSTNTADENHPAAEAQQSEAPETEATTSAAAPDAESTTASSDAATNGKDNSHQKGASASKELAQLGLGSFGDNGDDEMIGPRRSRRGPGVSPDPKARVPKTEPDTDTPSLQDPSTADNAEPVASHGVAVDEDDVNAASRAANEDGKGEAEASTAPEEVADEVQPDAKVEKVEEQDETQATEDDNQAVADSGNAEDVEADYGDADEQGDLDGEEGGDEGVTRCVCGSADENVGLMIQCETCKCWQHCVCMGMQVEEDCPDVYFCEQCRPELHIPLLRSLGLLPKASKKGTGKGAKYSARELKEAKEAIALLAEENARRNEVAEAAAAYNSRDRKGGSRRDEPKEVPKSPKRRSTMNSRDSAYGGWEPIPPGLLADGEVWEGADDRKGGKKRKRGHPDDAGDSAAQTPEVGEGVADAAVDAAKRRRMSAGGGHSVEHDGDADMDEDDLSGGADHSASASKSHKKKKGNNQYTVREASVTADSSASKPRHPNQYTYRNKDKNGNAAANGQKTGSSSTSNLTSHSPSPSPSKGRAEHARRAAARDNGSQIGTPAPGESSGTASRGGQQSSTTQWGLPEHLTHLAYLLPNGGSRSGSSKPSGSANENGSAGKKGTTSLSASSSGQTSSGPTPPAGASFPTPFHVLSSIESSTKVRFPSRRMTMGEMRKRVRNIGEYVTRSQIEAVEREKRMKLLGIVPPYMEEMEEEVVMEAETTQDDTKDAAGNAAAESGSGENADQEARKEEAGGQGKQEQLPLSMRLMEELTRELINFQRKFGIGPGNYGSLSNSNQSATVS